MAANLIDFMWRKDQRRIDSDREAQAEWAQTVRDAVKGTALENAESWDVGINVSGKARGILACAGGIANYIKACDAVAEGGYEGFRVS